MTAGTTPSRPSPHAAQAELEDWGPLEEATGPAMSTSGVTLWSEGDQADRHLGVHAGTVTVALETHEFVHIVAGRMTVTVDGGQPVELGGGDTAVFPKGWSGTWEIAETIRKLYVIF